MGGSAMSQRAEATAGGVRLTLASGQFLMTLDSSVMNVAIATVAEDAGTTVTGIQAAITLYTPVIAIMVAGGTIAREVAGDGSALPAGFPSSPTSLFRMN